MRLKFPRSGRLSWPRRKRAPKPGTPVELTGVLRAFRSAALWGVALLIATATASAFTESYRGLFEWATHHHFDGFWAAAFPLQVDLFIAVGELVLFIAMLDSWQRRDQAGAWLVAMLGLAVSIAGNVGHIAAHDLQSRGTAAVPPVAAFGALWLGLGVLKRILRRRNTAAVTADETAPEPVAETIPAHQSAAMFAELAAAVRAISERPPVEAPQAADRADETALLGELLSAVRDLGGKLGGTDSAPVPTSAEHAALIALRATTVAGNPLSMNALQTKFELTRAQVLRVRAEVPEETGSQPAPVLAGSLNGSKPGHEEEPGNE